jgi:cytochrome c oxidase assembly factor CtaG
MPPIAVLAGTWRFDPAAALLLALAAAGYGAGVHRVVKSGGRWPRRRTLSFCLLGLGSYLVASFGFLGVYSPDLRWAFAIRTAALLMVVPGLAALGRPLALARAAMPPGRARRLCSLLLGRPLRLLGHPLVGPVVCMGLFALMLTPAAGYARTSPGAETLLTLALPLLGLALILPTTDAAHARYSPLMVLELLFVFIELMADAIPGIALRLNTAILDRVPAAAGTAPGWLHPSPLHDQHLAGDWLWFICEMADLPLHVLLVLRYLRSDAREARRLDALSDEEMDALAEAHLHR